MLKIVSPNIKACLVGGVLLTTMGIGNLVLGETTHLIEPFSEKAQNDVKEVIKQYYDTLYKKYKSDAPSPSAPLGLGALGEVSGEAVAPSVELMLPTLQKDLDFLKETQLNKSGFKSAEELHVSEPKVEVTLPVVYVSLSKLKEYKEGDPLENLIVSTGSYYVAIEKKDSKGLPVAVLVQSAKGDPTQKEPWHITQSGASRIYEVLSQGRQEIINEYGSPNTKYDIFAIFVPAAKRFFLGVQGEGVEGNVQIKLLTNGPGDLKKGQLVPAEQVITELAKEANDKRYDWPRFDPKKPRSSY